MGSWQTLNGTDTGGKYALDDKFGYQSGNKHKEREEALAGSRICAPLGGSREVGRRSASYTPVISWLEIELDGTHTGGLTIQARVEVKTENVATSVTPKIRNVTDGSDAIVGAAYSADTNWNAQTLAFTPVSGVKKYRLEMIGGNATNSIFGIGYLEHYANPA